MPYKQLTVLFICNLLPFIVGNSLMALLPIYISRELGAGSAAAGVAIASAFAALAISTNLTPAIGRRFRQRRDVITVSAALCLPLVWLLGQTQQVIVFTVLLSLVWFFGGMVLATTQILTALLAGPAYRGRAFGVLATAGPLGMLFGGLIAGQIVDRWGFGTLFVFSALLYGLALLMSRAITEPDAPADLDTTASPVTSALAPMLLLVMAASVLAHVANFVITVTRPLAMDALQFEAAAITSTIAISGLITVALPFAAGWLSDRVGRKPVFVAAYVGTAAGAAVFLGAGQLWHFWLAQALVSMLISSMVVGTALVADLVPRQQVDIAVARFSATPWIGAVIGSTTAGFTVQQFGTGPAFILATGLLVIAIMLALALRAPRPAPVIEPARQHRADAPSA